MHMKLTFQTLGYLWHNTLRLQKVNLSINMKINLKTLYQLNTFLIKMHNNRNISNFLSGTCFAASMAALDSRLIIANCPPCKSYSTK